MLERTLEIALSRYPDILDPEWELVGPTGRDASGSTESQARNGAARGEDQLLLSTKGSTTAGG